MRQFMMAVMALAAFGAMVVTAQAESRGGTPPRNAGQCFKYAPGGNDQDGRFGVWVPCPQQASKSKATAAAPGARVRRTRAEAH